MKRLALSALFVAAICLSGCGSENKGPVAGEDALLKNHVHYIYNEDLETLSAQVVFNGYYEDEGDGTTPCFRTVLPEYNGMKVTHVYGRAYSLTKVSALNVCVYFDASGVYQGEYASLGTCTYNIDEFNKVGAKLKFYSDWYTE